MDNLRVMRTSSDWSKLATKTLAWLVVAGVFVVVFVAVRFILDAYWNAERLKDVQTITVALRQYAADHDGRYPADLEAEEKQLGSSSIGCEIATPQCSVSASNCLNLATELKPYLGEIPSDPAKWDDSRTRYTVRVERGGGLLVTACDYSK
ncbi:MAG: hypothetical protein WBO92_05315 [Candidatus Moraniibacteriota bacterium]